MPKRVGLFTRSTSTDRRERNYLCVTRSPVLMARSWQSQLSGDLGISDPVKCAGKA